MVTLNIILRCCRDSVVKINYLRASKQQGHSPAETGQSDAQILRVYRTVHAMEWLKQLAVGFSRRGRRDQFEEWVRQCDSRLGCSPSISVFPY